MFVKLLALFIVLPLVELFLLLWLSQVTSIWITIATVLLTGLIGTALAKSQGGATITQIRREMGAGRMPGGALADAALIVVAGALLMTPGLLTDGVGFALLIPAGRRWVKRRILNWAQERFRLTTVDMTQSASNPFQQSDRSVVDSYVVHGDDVVHDDASPIDRQD